jgi:cytochrome c oxidase assembly protein subunit 15
MNQLPAAADRHSRAVRIWLLVVAALVLATVMVGGATRLTESGLSIVEWKPVTGALPPLNEAAWQAEFQKYRAIPQYQQINRGMALGEFKTIYWWEWTHRLLGRVIGVAFLLPFLFFLARGWIAPRWRVPLWAIFGLGALQGAVGWWMVSSGLSERTSVSQYRLAFHLTLACVIYAAIVWVLDRMRAPPASLVVPTRIHAIAGGLVGFVVLQVYLGALVAGLDAGLTYNTWPLMDGRLLPPAEQLFAMQPVWRNFFENILTVQFNHRMTAYALWLLAVLHALDVARNVRGRAITGAFALTAAITMQAMIGILTLLQQAPIGLALLHQAVAMVVLTIAVLHAGRLIRVPVHDVRTRVTDVGRLVAPGASGGS